MSNVKKAFQPIVELLEANRDRKVSSVIDDVIALAASKARGGQDAKNHIKDVEGNVVAICCYYFKRWMPLVGELAVEFGTKAGSATGLNSMCKEGVSNWSKQQRDAKKATEELLPKVASGEITAEDIPAYQADIEAIRSAIVDTELGFETQEKVRQYLADHGIEVNI